MDIFSHLFVVKIVMCVWKDKNKWKRGRGWPIFWKWSSILWLVDPMVDMVQTKRNCKPITYFWFGPFSCSFYQLKAFPSRCKRTLVLSLINWSKKYTFQLLCWRHEIREREMTTILLNNKMRWGQWLCGSVDRAVASNTRGPWFKSSHWQKFIYIEHMFTVNVVLKKRT